MTTNDEHDELDDFLDAWEAEIESPAYKHGFEIGLSFGLWEAQSEALAAYQAGEIELWLEAVTPKTIEEWAAFEAKHGSANDLGARWGTKKKDEDNGTTDV